MKFLVVLCAALAVACGEPAAVGYAYSAAAPAIGYPWAAHAYGYGYSPLAYSAAPAIYSAPVAAPAVYSAPIAAPAFYSAPVAAPVVAPIAAAPIKSQYHSQDELGQASYGHVEPTQSHNAVQDAAGNKVGSFSFVNADGKLVRTDYVADALGYRVASNDLPAAPVVAPVAPEDTPEVAAAKAAHLAEVAKASSQSRKRRAIAYPYSALAYPYAAHPYPHAYPTTHTVPVVTADGFLADTPEVAAAKAHHFAEHAAAHARGKRAAVITPAATTPLVAAAPAHAYVAPYSPIAYSAASAYPYSAYPYSAYPYSAYPYSAYPYSAYPYSAAFYKK